MKLLELVSDTLSSTYPPEPRNKTACFWLLRTLTRVVDKCPSALLSGALAVLQGGVATWVEDEYRALTLDEYAVDVSAYSIHFRNDLLLNSVIYLSGSSGIRDDGSQLAVTAAFHRHAAKTHTTSPVALSRAKGQT